MKYPGHPKVNGLTSLHGFIAVSSKRNIIKSRCLLSRNGEIVKSCADYMSAHLLLQAHKVAPLVSAIAIIVLRQRRANPSRRSRAPKSGQFASAITKSARNAMKKICIFISILFFVHLKILFLRFNLENYMSFCRACDYFVSNFGRFRFNSTSLNLSI